MSKMNKNLLEFIACIPHEIQPDWDEKYAPVLVGFPVSLVFTRIRQPKNTSVPPQFVASCYQFDPSTFRENAEKRQMNYRSRANPNLRVEVALYKGIAEIEVTKFRGETYLWQASGATFDGAMMQASLMGMAGDEVEDAPCAFHRNTE